MVPFETVWAYLQANLEAGTIIRNWTLMHGYLGDTMKVVAVRGNSIEIEAPNAENIQVVPKEDFEKLWDVWSDYKSRTLKRNELRELTRFSKYIISILHWYENA
ncbi:MAG: hypothetical protein ABSA51_02925 [Anaerolineaceae bacterium]